MKKLFLFSIVLPFLSFQCKEQFEPNQANVQASFKPVYDGQPFVINQVYTIEGKKIRFTRLSFFVSTEWSDLSNDFIKKGGAVHLLDFSDLDQTTKSANGITKNINLIVGEQRSFKLDLGVESFMNLRKPVDFGSETPLSEGSNYWDDWKSYIFLKLEGTMDRDGDGRFESGITLHTGGNEAYRVLNFAKTFTVQGDGSTKLSFTLNINTLLRDIDLMTVNATHQTGDKPTMLKLMDNLKDAILIN
jgi:hypothetical protein